MQSACVALPREGTTGKRPPGYFGRPQQFGGVTQSPGPAGGGGASFSRGSGEEPGSPASRISMGLLVVEQELFLFLFSARGFPFFGHSFAPDSWQAIGVLTSQW